MKESHYMLRCFELARRGEGRVRPNPLVGCVIVTNGHIVGEGFHAKFGGPHAEVAALKVAGRRARGGTMYVNLEPCVHHGKTPPCVDAIIRAGVKKVVTAQRDPNHLVAGKGIRALRSAGIAVSVGVMLSEARRLNAPFCKFHESGLPYVGIKIAQTLDGKIADEKGRSKWITSPAARAYGRSLRASFDAIMVGASTVLKDNPRLTTRTAGNRNPVRVIVDGRFMVPTEAHVFSDSAAQTILLTSAQALKRKSEKAVRLERHGVTVLGIESRTILSPGDILRTLASLGITSVMIEGGVRTISPFLERNMVDEIHCFITPRILGSGLPSATFGHLDLNASLRVSNVKITVLGPDVVLEGNIK